MIKMNSLFPELSDNFTFEIHFLFVYLLRFSSIKYLYRYEGLWFVVGSYNSVNRHIMLQHEPVVQ